MGCRLGTSAIGVLCGCASAPVEAPFVPPVIAAEVTLRPGSVLTGVTSTVPTGAALAVQVEWTWVEGPLPELAPAVDYARSFVMPTRSEPFAVGAAAATDLCVGVDGEAEDLLAGIAAGTFGRSAPAASCRAALWRGSTAAFGLVAGAEGSFWLAVERDDDGGVRPIVTFPDQAPPVVGAVLAPPPMIVVQEALRPERAVVFLDARVRDPSLVWRVRVLGAADGELVQEGRAQLAQAADAARHVPPDTDGERRRVVVEALAYSWTRRRALVLLAQEHDVPLVADVALLADDAMVASLAETLVPELQGAARRVDAKESDGEAVAGEPPAASVTPAWILERAAARVLAAGALAAGTEHDGLAPELASVAQIYLGETVRSATTLLAALGQARTSAEFRAWVRAEHEVLLGDSQPAPRVRAFDWLRTRGAAPAGFDPLASKAERRAALAKAEQSP